MSETAKKTSRLRGAVIDVSILAGGASLIYGVAQIYRPAGFVVAGLLFLALGLQGARG